MYEHSLLARQQQHVQGPCIVLHYQLSAPQEKASAGRGRKKCVMLREQRGDITWLAPQTLAELFEALQLAKVQPYNLLFNFIIPDFRPWPML